QAARETAESLAQQIKCEPNEVIVSSTGVIGRSFPLDKIRRAMLQLVQSLLPTNLDLLARGIMTTDTVPKTSQVEFGGVHIAGVAKGAGMIHPDMATMLSFI